MKLKTKGPLTAERARECLDYDPATGRLTWKIRTARCVWPGAAAGEHVCSNGYRHISIDRWTYKVHRVVWLIVHGQWPRDGMDHINGDRADNRIANLREATQTQNNGNMKRSTRNRSGFKGVSWDKTKGKWLAKIKVGLSQRQRIVGSFDRREDAHEAYVAAAKSGFGDFAFGGER